MCICMLGLLRLLLFLSFYLLCVRRTDVAAVFGSLL